MLMVLGRIRGLTTGARELASLPLGVIGHFTGLPDECVAKGVWPEQLHLNVMPVLGKPTGGEMCC